ncbi:MAG: ABC transporter transmembrane domain-containing protein [Segetibacter sp.]
MQLIFPYLTQSIVDTGINTQNLNFIQIVLAASTHAVVFANYGGVYPQPYTTAHQYTYKYFFAFRLWAKLLKLPMQFFDSKHPGDIIQRIGDHHRIESFLTGTALNTFFLFSILLFSLLYCLVITQAYFSFLLSAAFCICYGYRFF